MSDKKLAEIYLKKAKNLISPRGFRSIIFRYKPKPKEAMEMYRKVAYHFKDVNLWEDAANAFIAAAKIFENDADEKLNTATNFADAGECYRKESPDDALKAYMKSSDIYIEMNELNLAAHQLEICSQIWEINLMDENKAEFFHNKANRLYKKHMSKIEKKSFD